MFPLKNSRTEFFDENIAYEEYEAPLALYS